MMKITETALVWRCGDDRLVGVLAAPAAGAGDTGVVIVVGGPQYRAGSHRQFTLLAREMAAAGYAVLRFDGRGMGDSEGEARGFEQFDGDIASAIDALQRQAPSVRRIVLWGLCDGASAALLYAAARRDARLAGLCLLNPWVRSAQSLAKAHVRHYYLQRLRQREFWFKLLRGGVALRATLDLARDIGRAARPAAPAPAAAASFQQRMLDGWCWFQGAVLLILSADDITAREFEQHVHDHPEWARALAAARVGRERIIGADHTFSSPAAYRCMADCCLQWLAHLAAPAAPAVGATGAAGGTIRKETCS